MPALLNSEEDLAHFKQRTNQMTVSILIGALIGIVAFFAMLFTVGSTKVVQQSAVIGGAVYFVAALILAAIGYLIGFGGAGIAASVCYLATPWGLLAFFALSWKD
jgi:uncharacterized BrkB/YihY/UPF0761 family membrane protein